MRLFKRKPKEVADNSSICCHKYKDFKWYIVSKYYPNTSECELKIFEPYVCVHCGDRKDKLLYEWVSIGSKKSLDNVCDKFIEEYGDKIGDRVIIEDEINDMVLVDREYMKFYDLVKSGKMELPELKT